MIPAQSSGAVPASLRFDGTRRHETLVDDDALGVAAIGDDSGVLVRRIKRERHIRAELLKARPALGTRAVGIDHAANRCKVARLEFRDCRSDFGHAANDLMTRNNRVHRRHEFAPLITHRVKIGMANTAEQDFDLHIVFGWIATRDCGGRHRRCGTGSGVSFCFVHGFSFQRPTNFCSSSG